MADQAALFGLIGALGGAVLGAGATLTVPLLTHRHARREQQRVRGEAEFDRLMALRQTTREVLIVLDDAHRTVLRREPLDRAAFSSSLEAALAEMRRSADKVAIDGLRFQHTRSTPEMRGWQRPTPETESMRGLVDTAHRMARRISDAHELQGDLDRETVNRLRRQYEAVENWRRALLGRLMERMEELRMQLS